MADNQKPLNEGTTRHIEKGVVKPTNSTSNSRPTQPPPMPRPQPPKQG